MAEKPNATSLEDSNAAAARHLWDLIRKRLEPGADTDAIDKEIWKAFGAERTIMFTDLSGFSRRVAEFGIIHFLQVIHEQMRVLVPIVSQHGGSLVKDDADSLLLLFHSVEDAVRCSLAMQDACRTFNQGKLPRDHLLLCVGIGSGPMLLIGENEVWGAEVNAASKLGEDTARAGEILLSTNAHAALGATSQFNFTPIEVSFPGTETSYRLIY